MSKAKRSTMVLTTVLLPKIYRDGLDELVEKKIYRSRSVAIRAAVRTELTNTLWKRKEVIL